MKLLVDEFGVRILSASLQGAVALAAALLIVHFLPRIPVLVKVWALRLAMLKMLLAAVFVGGVSIAVAPAAGGTAASPSVYSQSMTYLLPATLALWVISVGMGLVRLVKNRQQLATIIDHSKHVTDRSVLDIYHRLCRTLEIGNRPDLKMHRAVVSPMLVHHRRSTIVLPMGTLATSTTAQIETALAHELAHHKHADLRWAWLSAAADLLFFFHPLVWLGIKKLRLYEECAADAAAMQAIESTPSAYSRTLLTFAEEGFLLTGACAMADSAIELDRRIKALYSGRKQLSMGYKALAIACVALAALALVPWSLSAAGEPTRGRAVSPARSLPEGAPIAGPMAIGG